MHRDPEPHIVRGLEFLDREIDRRELRSARGEGKGVQPVVGREIFVAHALDVLEVRLDIAWHRPFAIRIAVAIDRPYARIEQALDRRIGVLGRVVEVRPVVERGHAGIERVERADVIGDVHVLGGIDLARDAANAAEILAERPIGGDAAQQALPGVAVGVDKAGDHDHVGAVDDIGVDIADIALYLGDLLAVDQDVAVGQHADFGIDGHDGGISN